MNVTEEIKVKIKEIIADKLVADAEDVKDETNLSNDLGMDSLDAVELVMEFEKEFDIRIDDDEAYQCKTVSELYTLLESI